MRRFSKTDAYVGALTTVVMLIAGLVIGLTTSGAVYVVLGVFASAILGLFIDLRLRIEETRGNDNESTEEDFRRFSEDSCPLFRRVARDKRAEVQQFLRNMKEDRIELHAEYEIFKMLEFLYKDVREIRTIWATSTGELGEWSSQGWWSTNYLKMQGEATKKRKAIHRVFITETGERAQLADALEKLNGQGAHTYEIEQRQVPSSALQVAANAIMFLDADLKPVYGLHATHGKGVVDDIRIYRDVEHLRELMGAFTSILMLAVPGDVLGKTWRPFDT